MTTLDDISGGRLTVGIGAGGTGFDAQVLGGGKWTPRQRADRFTAPPQHAGAAPKRRGLRLARRARPTAAHTRRAWREWLHSATRPRRRAVARAGSRSRDVPTTGRRTRPGPGGRRWPRPSDWWPGGGDAPVGPAGRAPPPP
ncbi:hypothetical protein B6264_23930 [Kitasatospora aureofaciens]|nr:hypothetical protein B6264_23930 [Kitasatospora aureofaciens]